MATMMISTRLDEELLAEIDTYATAKGKSRSEAIVSLLHAGLGASGGGAQRLPGWDAREIARIAYEYYRGLAAMFDAHNWPERGSQMLPVVQRRVMETYGSVEQFVEFHALQKPHDFQKDLASKLIGDVTAMDKELQVTRVSTQRDYMRELVRKHGLNKEPVCAAFAEALRSGRVRWRNNSTNSSAEKYADAVWRDGEIKGWLPG